MAQMGLLAGAVKGLGDSMVQKSLQNRENSINWLKQQMQLGEYQMKQERHNLDTQKTELEIDQLKNPTPTSVEQQYLRAKSEGFEGNFIDYQSELKKAGATQVTTNIGDDGLLPKPPKGFMYVKDETAPHGIKQVPISGSDEDLKRQTADQAKGDQFKYKDVALQDVRRMQDKIKSAPWYNPTTGLIGNFLKDVGGTAAADVNALATSIKASIGFDRLQEMREASPTGGALGQVSNMELRQLNAALGNLEQTQSEEQLLENLERIEAIYIQVMEKAQAYPNAAEFGFGKIDTSDEESGSNSSVRTDIPAGYTQKKAVNGKTYFQNDAGEWFEE